MAKSKKILELELTLSTLKYLTDAIYKLNGQSWQTQGYKDFNDLKNAYHNYIQNCKGAFNVIRTLLSIKNRDEAEKVAKELGFNNLQEFIDLFNNYKDYWLNYWKNL
ncbi:MAG: hypothetical protein QXE31_03005 [Candidatus Woesearchaeota archaeon]